MVKENLDYRLNEKLTQKAGLAAFSYFLIYGVIVIFTDIFREDAFKTIFFGSVLGIFGGARIFLARHFPRLSASQFKAWKYLFYASILFCGLAWGLFCYWIISRYGSDRTTFIVLFPTAGIIGATVISLAPVYKLLRMQVICLTLPIVVACLLQWDQGTHAFAVLAAIYFFYILLQAKTASQMVVKEVQQAMTIFKQKEDLELSSRQIEAAMKVKDDFLAMMSHEIRTPLNGVIGMADLVLQEGLAPQTRDRVKAIHDCGETLLVIVNDVLDFSKIESGKMSLDEAEFDLIESLQSAGKMFRNIAQKKNIQLQLYIDPACPRQVIGDSIRIRQVLLNLLSNAIKFTDRGEISVQVGMMQKSSETYELQVSVTDTGIGISEEVLSRLFQPFTQADSSTTRKYGGTGLGLSICRKLTELMGGKIKVASTPGRGSTFSFSIPVRVVAKIESQESDRWPTQLKKILIVEDNVVSQKIMEAMLEKCGYGCVLVSNGIECIQKLKDSEYSLVFMNCQMPGLDGYETTKKIRQFSQIPIIAMTANALSGDREKCLQSGMTDYLSKPIKESTLLEAIRLALAIDQKRTA